MQSKEIPFTGDFEDSDLEEESEDSGSEESGEEQRRPKRKKTVNLTKKLVMNVSGSCSFDIDTQYPVVKFVGKMLYKFKLQYVPYLESTTWDLCWTDNAVQPETLAKMQRTIHSNDSPPKD